MRLWRRAAIPRLDERQHKFPIAVVDQKGTDGPVKKVGGQLTGVNLLLRDHITQQWRSLEQEESKAQNLAHERIIANFDVMRYEESLSPVVRSPTPSG
jgi:hypothetical protein